MNVRSYRLGDLCRMVKGVSPTLKTLPGQYPLVVTAEYRRSAETWQIEGPAVCVPLVSSTGHGDAALHRVHYQEGRFALANLLVALLPKDSSTCNAKYLYYLLMARKEELLVPLMLGTANVSLKEKDIARVEVCLPPLPEQRRIVGRIEELAAQIQEARTLRQQATEEAETLLVAMAHRADLDSSAKERGGWRYKPLSDLIRFTDDSHRVSPDCSYPNLGIYSFGRGLFHKPLIDGLATSATSLRRVKAGQFIYSRLFAFEGAYGMVTSEFDGLFVSNEYPTFDCDLAQIRAEFLAAYFRPAHVWKTVAEGSKGLGDRRQRVQPAQVLAHKAWIPPMVWQNRLAQVQVQVDTLKRLQAETAAELDALLPSILDKAFKGDL